MKKNVFEMVVALVNGQPVADMDTLRNEINAEYERMNAKRNANKSVYDTAKDVAFGILCDKPMTVKEVFAAGEGEDDFGLAGAVGERDGAADQLIGEGGVDVEGEAHANGGIEFGRGGRFDESGGFFQFVDFFLIDFG